MFITYKLLLINSDYLLILQLLFIYFTVDAETFASTYGHSNDFSLADAFWSCGIMFSNWLVTYI